MKVHLESRQSSEMKPQAQELSLVHLLVVSDTRKGPVIPQGMSSPNRESHKQASRSAINQSLSHSHKQCCPNRPTNSNQLNMSRFQPAMCGIVLDLDVADCALAVLGLLPALAAALLTVGVFGILSNAMVDDIFRHGRTRDVDAGRLGSHVAAEDAAFQ
jgi:hypothetical protein